MENEEDPQGQSGTRWDVGGGGGVIAKAVIVVYCVFQL